MKSMHQRILIALTILLCIASGNRAIGATYAFTNIADSTMQASFGAPYRFFTLPSVSGGDIVSFTSRAQDTSLAGVFSGSGGPVTTIAKTGDAAPLGTFTLFFQWSASSNDGTTAFVGGSTGGSGVYTGTGGAVSTIAKVGDPAPIGTFSQFNATPDTDSGTAVFVASYNSGANKGLFTKNGGTLTTIAKSGDAAPSGTFTDFDSVMIDGNVISFGANSNGIYKWQGGSITTIAKGGDAAPVGVFDPMGLGSLSGGTVAFSATYSFHSLSGIFTGSGGALTTIAKSGDPAPVGVFGSVLTSPSLVDDTIAFRATYGPGNNGILVNKNGQFSELIKIGDALFGSTVSTLSMGTFALDRSGSGNLAFLYSLADGRSGVALAQPVPEPSSCLLAVAVVGLCAAGTRRRGRASSN